MYIHIDDYIPLSHRSDVQNHLLFQSFLEYLINEKVLNWMDAGQTLKQRGPRYLSNNCVMNTKLLLMVSFMYMYNIL